MRATPFRFLLVGLAYSHEEAQGSPAKSARKARLSPGRKKTKRGRKLSVDLSRVLFRYIWYQNAGRYSSTIQIV